MKGSYGAGINFNFAIGYKFNKNFIFDLGFIYLAGKKYETFYRNAYNSPTGLSTLIEQYYTSFSRGFYFNPSFVFSAVPENRPHMHVLA